MHFSTLFIVPLFKLSLGSVLQARAACNANNCARAVTGTGTGITPAFTVRQSDCFSFQKTTVTPAPIITTTTITITGNLTLSPTSSNPTTTPITPTHSPPVYASACSGTSRYASACSCFNITATTTTLPPSTLTATVSATPTPAPSTSCTKPGVCGTFQNCGSSTTCFCGGGVNSGSTICFADEACDSAPPCTTDADCAGTPGTPMCLLSSCCPGGVCVNVDTCVNPNQARKVFVKKSVGEMWMTGLK